MGCFDIYCLICGNPYRGLSSYNIDDVKKIILSGEKDIISEEYFKNPNLIKDLKKMIKQTLWMNKCTMLLTNNEVKHNCEETSCNGLFSDIKNKNSYTHLIQKYNVCYYHKYSAEGVFIHTDCYKYIKLKYNIKLTYSNLPLIDDGELLWRRPIKYIKYGEIEYYWGQYLKFENICIDKKQYLCSSPLKNDKNISQINKNINGMKISNKYILRPSPPISATYYKKNNIKFGNNGKLWIIKNSKWNEINEDIYNINITIDFKKINSKQKSFLKKLSFISQFNNYGVFVKTITFLNENIFILEIISTINNKNLIKKLFNI